MSSFSLRPQSVPSSPAGAVAAGDPGFVSKCPSVWAYLHSTVWEDGSPREPATLILLVDLGRWKVCLSDRANNRVAWLSADTLGGLLEGLEAGLVEDKLDWRRAKAPPGRRGR